MKVLLIITKIRHNKPILQEKDEDSNYIDTRKYENTRNTTIKVNGVFECYRNDFDEGFLAIGFSFIMTVFL